MTLSSSIRLAAVRKLIRDPELIVNTMDFLFCFRDIRGTHWFQRLGLAIPNPAAPHQLRFRLLHAALTTGRSRHQVAAQSPATACAQASRSAFGPAPSVQSCVT